MLSSWRPPPADQAALPRWLLGLAFPGAAVLGDQAPVRVLHERQAADLTQPSRSAHFIVITAPLFLMSVAAGIVACISVRHAAKVMR